MHSTPDTCRDWSWDSVHTGHLTETAFIRQSGVGPLFEIHTAEDKCRISAYGCIPDDKEGAKKPVHVRRNDVNLGQRISP